MFRWRLPATSSVCWAIYRFLLACFLPRSSSACAYHLPPADTGLRAPAPARPAARAPPSCRKGLALGGARPGWGAQGKRSKSGWVEIRYPHPELPEALEGGVSRGCWRPLCFPAVGETSVGKMGLYRVRVSTGSSLCAGSNNQVHLWLVGEHGGGGARGAPAAWRGAR